MNKTTTYCLLAFASLIIIGSYFYLAIPDCIRNYAICFQSQAPAPYRYRILQPTLESILASDGSQGNTLLADFMLQALLSPVIIVGLWKWLKRWSDDTRALVGVLLFAILSIASYHFYMRGISTTIEIACVVWMLVYIDRFWVVGLLTIVASINKETAVVLVFLFIAYHGYKPGYTIPRYVALMLSFTAIQVAIHIALGASDHVLGLVGTFGYNWQNIGDAIFTNILLLPLVIAVIVAYKSSPSALKRLLWVAVLYVLAIVIGAAWNETMRLLLPVLPIALAAVMYKPVEVVERANNFITLDRAPAKGEVVSVRYTVDFGEN